MASILFFLFWAGLFLLMMRFGCGAHVMGHGHDHGNGRSDRPTAPSNATGHWAVPDTDVDPVCRMTIETAKAKSAVYEGHAYHFCSQDCRAKFEAEPKKYLTPIETSSKT